MLPKNILILGASNTGKTNLANLIAAKLDIPIFNCDSVQVYKHLNLLTNKPEFIRQEIVNDELVSTLEIEGNYDLTKYENIEFNYIRFKKGKELYNKVSNYAEFFAKLVELELIENSTEIKNKEISNYLFDIREPLENYSTIEFNQDIDRIDSKLNSKSKIIVGGTVYYAQNFVLRNPESLILNPEYQVSKELEDLEIERLIELLKEKDPESIEIVDIKNKRRIVSALSYIESTGKKYSENYFKKKDLLDDFLLIILQPKNREEYYKSLDKVIESRLNENSLNEIDSILANYGEEVREWLQKVSYEYKYFLDIFDIYKKEKAGIKDLQDFFKREDVSKVVQELKFKEHQYGKRQMTFLRRLVKELRKHGHNNSR